MSPPTSFADLGVPADMVAVLARRRIHTPFEIQVATIPDGLARRDVLGRAPTGSGKTLAFGIPLLVDLPKAQSRRPTGLILSPTRELAEQIGRELQPLAEARKRTVLTVYGGVGFGNQLRALRNGVDLVVACPGRLLDLIEQGEMSLEAVQSVVVDEADRMADMGFLPDVRRILDRTNSDRHTTLFSATLGREVAVLTARYQTDPVTHEVGQVEPDLSLVTHRFIRTERSTKISLAANLIDEAGPTLVFCRTRHGVDRVSRQLKNAGIKTGWIHGGRSQNQRDTALASFTRGKVDALVATDVAARGIHVDGVACVIHFDPPEDEKAYVHRSGRTARAGASGVVISFVNCDQVKSTRRLQRDVGLDHSLEDASAAETAPRPESQTAPTTQHKRNSTKPKPTSKPKHHGRQRTKSGPGAGSGRSRHNKGKRNGRPNSRPKGKRNSRARR